MMKNILAAFISVIMLLIPLGSWAEDVAGTYTFDEIAMGGAFYCAVDAGTA